MIAGFINLYKPKYLYSNTCINIAKKCLNLPKIGHSGTLDSYAEGVLLLAIGQSTKLLPYLHDSKTYEATFRFGQSSPSYDCSTYLQ